MRSLTLEPLPLHFAPTTSPFRAHGRGSRDRPDAGRPRGGGLNRSYALMPALVAAACADGSIATRSTLREVARRAYARHDPEERATFHGSDRAFFTTTSYCGTNGFSARLAAATSHGHRNANRCFHPRRAELRRMAVPWIRY
jgi:hypothetical protein